jgi:transcriptional regulator with XRE-family HTH domain
MMPNAAEIQTAILGELDLLREMAELGIREFCDQSNVGTSTWYDYRSLKTSPPLDDLCRMAEAVKSSLYVRVLRASAEERTGEDMRTLRNMETREVALLMERMSEEQRAYLLDVARAIALPQTPARDK